MSEYYEGQQLYTKLGHLKGTHWVKSTKIHSNSAADKHPDREVVATVEKVGISFTKNIPFMSK